MSEPDEIPSMRPVRADDVIPETRWALSPKRAMINLGILILVWAAVSVAINLLHVPFSIFIAVGGVCSVAALVFEFIRWRRRRRS